MTGICPKGYTIQELGLDEPCEGCGYPPPCILTHQDDEEWLEWVKLHTSDETGDKNDI